MRALLHLALSAGRRWSDTFAHPPIPNGHEIQLCAEICPALTDGAITVQGYRKFRQVTHEASRDAIIAVKLPAPGVHSCQAPELAVVLPGGTTASWRRFLV